MTEKLKELIEAAAKEALPPRSVCNPVATAVVDRDRRNFIAGATDALSNPDLIAEAGLVKKEEWIDVKPLNDKERLFMSATYYDGWNYQTWQLVKMEGEDENGEAGYYYGLCDESGEEWGDYDDLQCDLYYELPLPAPL